MKWIHAKNFNLLTLDFCFPQRQPDCFFLRRAEGFEDFSMRTTHAHTHADLDGMEASCVLCVATQRHCPIELAVSMLI